MEANLEFWISALRAFAVVAALSAFGWALRRQRHDFAEQLGLVLAAQQQARAETQALAERVGALTAMVAAIPARVERTPEAPPHRPRRESSPVRSYETARRLARSGASVEEIVATCGVAGAEARLLQRLLGAQAGREDAA